MIKELKSLSYYWGNRKSFTWLKKKKSKSGHDCYLQIKLEGRTSVIRMIKDKRTAKANGQ